ncbi:shikimate dehydrogenase [Algibacter amylolyticus]|uniref:Shikimate dehydrogenase n=1 Tax=Algibacter amylolyticus TaxID=1608400 RepID=A0A5M7B101_9FLAO|nr:shikimate dehydrogenase [Algibacter amylolyticus]KAA5821918.1 shikimate dehydrogenase [Algibacter amylolyticus]MBB5269284.1 shikimate dehydrogenase [Algibacter amylolyticus]TSJ73202.1 shikimate dehydrogenase [Algibacter amylolyticus]
MNKLGLLGKDISYSFSRTYFKKKFENENIKDTSYENFDIKNIDLFPSIIKETEGLKGMNVTIPYKEQVMPFLDKINKKAKAIGAVNTIRITKKGKLIGYNTDCYGFKNTIKPFIKLHHKKALILGTGGASKAIAYSLNEMGISYQYVSRNLKDGVTFSYDTLTEQDIEEHQIIVNCTPLGTFPNIQDCPNIPYKAITKNHILFDLIYNPEETRFLNLGKQNNATIINGLNMLRLQAEKSWSIWGLK